MDRKFRKNAIWNCLGTGINAFNSLFLMIIVTRINGVSLAGVFTFAFSTATLFNVIGVYAGRVYQVTDKGKFNDKEYFMNRVISCLIMFFISIVFVVIKGYNLTKVTIIMLLCFLKMLEAFAEVLYAFFQKDDDLYKVGISLTAKTLIGLLLFFIVDFFTKKLILAILMFVLVYIVIMVFYDFRQLDLKKRLNQKWGLDNVLSIFVKGFSTFFSSFLTIYIINASKYAIDGQMTDDIQAIFGIIVMPATIMILIAQFLIHPFLIKINNEIKDNNYINLKKLIFKICLSLFGAGILIIIACDLIGIYVLEFIYGLSLREYSLCLSIILFGAILYALTSVINTVLIAMRHTFIQMIVYTIMAIFSLIISNILVSYYEIMGASLSYFVVMLVNFIIFIIIFLVILRKENKVLLRNELIKRDGLHTFVVLAYKESKYLEECIKSVLNQSYKSKVVIATTTDNDFIRSLAKKYKLKVVVGKHTNIGGDFDFAVSCSDTELVTVAHQDDIYEYDYAKVLVDEYINNNNASIIFSDYFEIRGNSKVSSNLNLKIKRLLLVPLRIKCLSGFKFIKRLVLRFGSSICCPAVTFVKDNCPREIFSCDYKCNVDWYAWEKLSKLRGSFIYNSKKLMGHRISFESTTTDIINNGIRTKEDYDMFCKFWPKLVANVINNFYKNSEKSNNMKK